MGCQSWAGRKYPPVVYQRVFRHGMGFINNYRAIQERIHQAARAAGRNAGDVVVIAVTKTFPPEVIQQAIDEGISLFGENRVQEARAKMPLLRGNHVFHLIGHLQSNKARDAVALFDMIHSIDSLTTAEKVNIEAGRAGKVQKILVEVNTSGEGTKNGVRPPEAASLCGGIARLENIELMGLMTVGPLTDDRSAIRGSFAMLRALLGEINGATGIYMKELSMGMSSDFEIAVEEGATMVRIGSALFGTRG
jgi:PLP dependent protein